MQGRKGNISELRCNPRVLLAVPSNADGSNLPCKAEPTTGLCDDERDDRWLKE
jgi:hypothetical protein